MIRGQFELRVMVNTSNCRWEGGESILRYLRLCVAYRIPCAGNEL